jgi:hypothetical protein
VALSLPCHTPQLPRVLDALQQESSTVPRFRVFDTVPAPGLFATATHGFFPIRLGGAPPILRRGLSSTEDAVTL